MKAKWTYNKWLKHNFRKKKREKLETEKYYRHINQAFWWPEPRQAKAISKIVIDSTKQLIFLYPGLKICLFDYLKKKTETRTTTVLGKLFDKKSKYFSITCYRFIYLIILEKLKQGRLQFLVSFWLRQNQINRECNIRDMYS